MTMKNGEYVHNPMDGMGYTISSLRQILFRSSEVGPKWIHDPDPMLILFVRHTMTNPCVISLMKSYVT